MLQAGPGGGGMVALGEQHSARSVCPGIRRYRCLGGLPTMVGICWFVHRLWWRTPPDPVPTLSTSLHASCPQSAQASCQENLPLFSPILSPRGFPPYWVQAGSSVLALLTFWAQEFPEVGVVPCAVGFSSTSLTCPSWTPASLFLIVTMEDVVSVPRRCHVPSRVSLNHGPPSSIKMLALLLPYTAGPAGVWVLVSIGNSQYFRAFHCFFSFTFVASESSHQWTLLICWDFIYFPAVWHQTTQKEQLGRWPWESMPTRFFWDVQVRGWCLRPGEARPGLGHRAVPVGSNTLSAQVRDALGPGLLLLRSVCVCVCVWVDSLTVSRYKRLH